MNYKPGDRVRKFDGGVHVLGQRLLESPHPSLVVDGDHPAWGYEGGGWDFEANFQPLLPITLTKPRRALLEALATYGGQLKAEQITIPDRRLATRMQNDGLVQWKAPAIQSRHTCLGQTLHITDAGRALLDDKRGSEDKP